jgi:hypothetical protein
LRTAEFDDAELAVAVSIVCLKPEITDRLSENNEVSLAFEEAYSIVRDEVIGKGLDQPLLCRDVVIAWGSGWHRARFDQHADGWDGRWIKSLLALTCLFERATEHALKLLSDSVDKIFTPRAIDPDSPGNVSVVSSYASLFALNAAANLCDCQSNRCHNKHRLSKWSPCAPNGRAYPLRAFAAQMARGDAGPRLLNKEFQNSALYPLLRDFHGLRFHEKVEFKLCHCCGTKYEVNECRYGTRDDPFRTKHFIFENAFWVKDHKLYAIRRRQLCRKPGCQNLYELREFNSCPLLSCGEGRTPNRATRVYVLEQRLDSRAVLHPDYHDVELEEGDELQDIGWDVTDQETLAKLRAETPSVLGPDGAARDAFQSTVERLVAEGKTTGVMTAVEASEISEKAKAGALGSEEVRHLALRNLLGKLYIEATHSADLFPDVVAQLEDYVFDKKCATQELEAKVITARARLLSKKGIATGVMTPSMEPQILELCEESESIEDALDRCAAACVGGEGLSQIVRTPREAVLE